MKPSPCPFKPDHRYNTRDGRRSMNVVRTDMPDCPTLHSNYPTPHSNYPTLHSSYPVFAIDNEGKQWRLTKEGRVFQKETSGGDLMPNSGCCVHVDGNNFLREAIVAIMEVAPHDQKTLAQKQLKLTEEVGELSRAVLIETSAHGTAHRGEANTLEELADTVIVALSMLSRMKGCPTLDDLERAILAKIPKWKKTIGLS